MGGYGIHTHTHTRKLQCGILTSRRQMHDNLSNFTTVGVFGGEEEGGGVRSRLGEARTILLFHIISARPSKQPRIVRTFLKVHTRPRLAYPLRCRGY